VSASKNGKIAGIFAYRPEVIDYFKGDGGN
jgi:hypothetical protein